MSENRHTAEDLKHYQSLPLDLKITMTKQRIREWLKEFGNEGVYVSFSGGKDSTVLLHIVRQMEAEEAEMAAQFGFDPQPPIPAVFVNTGLEYPEIQKFAMSQPGVATLRPEMRFDEVVKRYGYPVISKEVSQTVCEAKKNAATGKYSYRIKKLNGEDTDKDGNPSSYNIPQWKFLLDAPYDISHKCCDVMKKNPAKKYEKETGRKPIIATMADESRLRYSKWLRFGCNAFEQKRQTSQPMSFWTEQDVLHYLKTYNVPYCSVYGEIVIDDQPEIEGQMNAIDYLGCYEPGDKLKTTGCDRTGCIFCMFGCHLEKEPNRFQRLKETHPRQYKYCIGGGEMVDGKWQPSKEGLGLGKVLDYIGVKYE